MEATEALGRVRGMAGPMMAAVREVIERTAKDLVGSSEDFDAFEAIVLAIANEGARQTLGADLARRAEEYGEAVRIDGKIYVEHVKAAGTYHSLCGTIAIERSTDRETGVHTGPTVVPLEREAGLVESTTPALAKAVTLGYAKHDLRSVLEDMQVVHRDPPSRATMDRVARAVAEHAHAEAPRIERQLRRKEKLPEGACGVVLGLDRGSVPMKEERAPGQPPATHRRTRTKPYQRKPPPPFDVNWRMAPVATVAITDKNGEALETRKYAATQAEGWSAIVERAMEDVRTALRNDPSLHVGVVQDGAAELWSLTRAALKAEPLVRSYDEAIDRFHLDERLGEALRIIEPDADARKQCHDRWRKDLDEHAGAIEWIELAIEHGRRGLDGENAAIIDGHLTYIANNKDRMNYATMNERGLPIGSGTTESACNTLLNLRTKRNAEHWSEHGLQGVLTLRATHRSNRFDPFWRCVAHDYVAHVTPVLRAA